VPLLHASEVWALAVSAGGGTLLTGSGHVDGGPGTAQLFDLKTGAAVRSSPTHPRRVRAVAIRPDGRTLLTGSWDRTLQFWEAATANPSGLRSSIPAAHHRRAVSPDGQRA